MQKIVFSNIYLTYYLCRRLAVSVCVYTALVSAAKIVCCIVLFSYLFDC